MVARRSFGSPLAVTRSGGGVVVDGDADVVVVVEVGLGAAFGLESPEQPEARSAMATTAAVTACRGIRDRSATRPAYGCA
jgi:hypothetical protein